MPIIVSSSGSTPGATQTVTLSAMRSLILRKLRYLDPGESPTSTDNAVVDEALNLRLKMLHKLGVIWYNVDGGTTSITLVAGTATKSLTSITDFLTPVSFKLTISGEDRDIHIISHREYQNIPTKADSGEPEKVFVSPAQTAYFWPTPDSNYTVKLTYQALPADVSTVSALDMPVALTRSIVTLTANDLVDDFGCPESLAQRLAKEAEKAERDIRALNTEPVDTTTVEMTSY